MGSAEIEEAVGGEERINEKTVNIRAKPFPNRLQSLALRNISFVEEFHGAQETQSTCARGELPVVRSQNETTNAGNKVKAERNIVMSRAMFVQLLLLQNDFLTISRIRVWFHFGGRRTSYDCVGDEDVHYHVMQVIQRLKRHVVWRLPVFCI